MIVDDQPTNVMVLKRLLQSAGVTHVETLTDSRDAVQRCLAIDAHLVLLDLHMPHLDGFGVLAGLQAALDAESFVPVVVLTADATPETRDRALAAGATDYLTKPFDHSEVVLRIRNLLATRELYADVQRHNAVLQARVDARAHQERELAVQRQQVVDRIDDILSADAIRMVFQPIADVRTGQVLGFEALARFEHRPLRPPNEWFNEAASVGRDTELEVAAATTALGHLEHLPDGVFLSINVSPSIARHPSFLSVFEDLPADQVVLELTEHAPVDDYPGLLASLAELRARGMRIAVDDAGAGYAGLQHILRLRPDILKLDIGLTSGIDADPARRALSTALVSFAKEIGAIIIAEGIETFEELETLRALNVPWGQGYYLGRPGEVPLTTRHLALRAVPSPQRRASP